MSFQRSQLGILKFGLLIVLAAFSQRSARADVGLPPAQPGSSLSPGDYQTNVQMVSEQVEIIIYDDGHHASVKADFQMHNNGTEDENIEVWFPFGETRPDSKAWKVIQVRDFQAWVEGEESAVTIEKSDEWNYIWAHWPVSFPADTPVTIQVSYTLSLDRLTGPIYLNGYTYILETGAGWEGVIEHAVITVQAPYKLQELDDLPGGPTFLALPGGYTVEDREIKWVLTDIEPTEADNIGFYFLSPDSWYSITESIKTLESNPNNGEAHYRLASGLRSLLTAQEQLATAGYIEPSPEISSLEELTAKSYQNALELSAPNERLYSSALHFFRWNSHLIESHELQAYYYQAVQLFPESGELQDAYQAALDAGVIAEGPAPSPTMPEPEGTKVSLTPESTRIPAESSHPATPHPVLFVAGIVLLGAGILLIFFLVKKRQRMEPDNL